MNKLVLPITLIDNVQDSIFVIPSSLLLLLFLREDLAFVHTVMKHVISPVGCNTTTFVSSMFHKSAVGVLVSELNLTRNLYTKVGGWVGWGGGDMNTSQPTISTGLCGRIGIANTTCLQAAGTS